MTTSQRRELLVETPESNREHRVRTLPATMAFEPIRFELDRNQELEIDLDIRFQFRLEGDGSITFSHGVNDVPLVVRTPQWSIMSTM